MRHRLGSPILLALAALLLLLGCGGPGEETPVARSSPAAPTAAATASHGAPATSAPAAGPLSQRVEVPLPGAREETAAAATGSTLMVAGGFDSAGRDRAEVFLLTDGAWKVGPALPRGIDHASAAAIGDTLYIAGGFSAGVAQAAVESLAPGGAAWTPLPPLTHPRGALALLPLAGRLYAIGGKVGTGAEVSAVESWAPGEALWTELTPLPAPRDHIAGFVGAGRLCIAGGRSPTSARVDCLGVAGAWESAPTLPAPTSGAAAGTVGTVTIVAGGEDAAETRLTGQVDTLAGPAWTTMPMLDPRHGMEAALFRGRLWLCGGGTAPGLHAIATCTSVGPG